MYELNLKNIDDLSLMPQTVIAENLGLTREYINKVFNGKLAVKLSTAKCIISLVYNISVRNSEQMQELLQKHFTEIK